MQAQKILNSRMLPLIIPLWIIWGTMQTAVLVWTGFPLRFALIDSAVSNGLLMVISLAVGNALQYYRPGKSKFLYIFIWNLCIAALWAVIVKWALSSLITDAAYLSFLYKSLPVRFFIAFLMTGWTTLLYSLTFSYEEIRQNEKRKTDTEKLSRDAELYKLRQQLQPHFLFNSLNSISSLTGNKPEEARRMIQQLADFLRGTLKNDEKITVSLEEELHYLSLYLDIEKVRFGHRLNTEITNDEASLKFRVPQMILQPIVENAIKFGLYDTTGAVTITVRARVNAGALQIVIQNPFDPQTSHSKAGTGFGLSSLQRRLYLLYASNNLIETGAEGNLFTTIVTIPQL